MAILIGRLIIPSLTWFLLSTYSKNAKAGSAFTGFIVDANTPGITLGRKENMLGQQYGLLHFQS